MKKTHTLKTISVNDFVKFLTTTSLAVVILLFLGNSKVESAQFSLNNAGYGLFVSYLVGYNDIVAAPGESWDHIVTSFNVNTFVTDVQATGATYVVFSLSQTSGYYCTNSDIYNRYTGNRTGEFTSTRDLILEIATALNNKGIAMFVYMDAVGPSSAQRYTRPDGTFVDPALGLDVDGQGRSSIFQARYQEMIRDWSTRWGTRIAGWWIDGAYVAGYVENPVLGYGTSGPTNLTNLINACKAGNPTDAIVACNPSLGIYTGMATSANYLCGEDGWLSRYPLSQYVSANGGTWQWNTSTYLGTTWTNGSVRFSNEQIASYVKYVKKLGGSVMLDIAVYRNGSLSAQQKTQMAYVNSIVKGGSPLPVNSDLAKFKPVRMCDPSTGAELAINGAGYQRYAGYGNDGSSNPNAVAMPGGLVAWSYVVDLMQNSTVARAVVTFPTNYFATKFTVDGSNNGTSWVTLATVNLTTAQINTNKVQTASYNILLPSNASMLSPRYVRLKAVNPNNVGQTGVQMGVQSFELY
jgi:hypothetical protein